MSRADPQFAPVDGTQTVLSTRQGPLARLRLNNPRAINALTLPMVEALLGQLRAWAADDAVGAVLLDGAGERGFCAGGDVRGIRSALLDGTDEPLRFWRREYELDATIAAYPKPVVAAMDGITMGGGLGLSAHARVRLVTPRSRIAMPETAIGFFPDVGMTYLLARVPGELGTHLALTGVTVSGADAITAGLADHLVDPGEIEQIAAEVARGGPVSPALCRPRPQAPIMSDLAWVQACYAGADAPAILRRLRERPEPAANRTADLLATRSPWAVTVTLAALRRAAGLDLAGVFQQDLVLGRAFLAEPDFVEGVRAVLVDKDNAPRWRHRHLDDVEPAAVAAVFEDNPARLQAERH
ncbi:MAG TPA: enoyl-CoA hydratase/isomerase family protein [Dermatophilaceae bacterium]|nr:enoyl-CoA hydratase/isomerase family protein [Dermatophilaceae bacterium]